MSLAMLQVYRYEYLGMISSEIDGETIEGHAVRKVTETVVNGGAEMEGMSLDMTATGRGSGTLYFGQRRGMLLHASSEDELSMEMTMVGPITMTIPMEMSYTTVVRRLP